MYLFLDCAVGVEDGELVEVDDVLARLRVALGEDAPLISAIASFTLKSLL